MARADPKRINLRYVRACVWNTISRHTPVRHIKCSSGNHTSIALLDKESDAGESKSWILRFVSWFDSAPGVSLPVVSPNKTSWACRLLVANMHEVFLLLFTAPPVYFRCAILRRNFLSIQYVLNGIRRTLTVVLSHFAGVRTSAEIKTTVAVPSTTSEATTATPTSTEAATTTP